MNPVCCSRIMHVSMELGRFTEFQCESCGDTSYMKNMDKVFAHRLIKTR